MEDEEAVCPIPIFSETLHQKLTNHKLDRIGTIDLTLNSTSGEEAECLVPGGRKIAGLYGVQERVLYSLPEPIDLQSGDEISILITIEVKRKG